jgi:signal-transduction protein with cAMP-binding, CBS, and nucleotidyltransferase domain
MLQQRLREEAERKEQERETVQQLTPEELQKLQEEDDLRVAMETFGVCNSLF